MSTSLSNTSCPVCSVELRRHLVDWVFRCPSCGFQCSSLAVDTQGITGGVEAIDESVRLEGLDALRKENFEKLLDLLVARVPPAGKKLLEVGSAHGWFLLAAQARGYEVRGIEPDTGVASRLPPETAALTSRGFFPDDLTERGPYDVIVFNDVFEHVPDVEAVLVACKQHLTKRGVLVLNLPYSSGVFYRASELLARIGQTGPFERMWQARFPSPHLSYFAPGNLRRLCEKQGFVVREQQDLRTLRVRGLWARLRYDQTLSRRRAALTWAVTAAATPLLSVLPADVGVQLFQLEEG